jgi:thioredoxin 1
MNIKKNKNMTLKAVLSIVIFSLIFFMSHRPSHLTDSSVSDKEIVNLNSENFDEFVKGKLVMVDFWASWCYPCRLQNPILEELNQEMGDQISIGKVNVDENKLLSNTYGITSIPTILVFRNGTVVERLRGLQQKSDLVAIVNKYKD